MNEGEKPYEGAEESAEREEFELVETSDESLPALNAVEEGFEPPKTQDSAVEPSLKAASPDEGATFSGEYESPRFYRETIKGRKTRRKKRSGLVGALVAACLAGGLAIGIGVPIGAAYAKYAIIPKLLDDSKQVANFSFPSADDGKSVSFSQSTGLLSYSDIVKQVEPSTVVIRSVIPTGTRFFEASGAGTGIIFAETETNYYICTNAHVIDGASEVSVSIAGGGDIYAKPVGKDNSADLAVISVLKSDALEAGVSNVKVAEFGDSDSMEPGDVVLAVGNALGEGNTVTNGIVSAKEKDISVEGRNLTVIQTNAAINKGNSGGPLVNLKGEIIGINTAKLSGTMDTTIEGTGFAIPSNLAKPIITKLMQTSQSGTPIIGIKGGTLTEEMASQYNLPPLGAFVNSVEAGFPAEAAGIKPGDIITGIDDEPVTTFEQLKDAISSHKVGDSVTLKILRDGKDAVTVTLKLAANNNGGF